MEGLVRERLVIGSLKRHVCRCEREKGGVKDRQQQHGKYILGPWMSCHSMEAASGVERTQASEHEGLASSFSSVKCWSVGDLT